MENKSTGQNSLLNYKDEDERDIEEETKRERDNEETKNEQTRSIKRNTSRNEEEKGILP